MTPAGIPAASELRAWYRELHSRPELAGLEVATSAWLARWLTAQGLAVHTGVGGHGVVAILANGAGPVVALRAEMDALPVATDPVQAGLSQLVGGEARAVSHACGHDLHMTAVLGATAELARNPHSWSGTLVVIFQPAEETGEGAARMVGDEVRRLLPVVDALLALHSSALPVGATTFRPGRMTSAGVDLEVTFRAPSGHSAFSVGPSALDVALQWVATVHGQEIPDVHVGSFVSGSCANVVPDSARLAVSIRSGELAESFARVRRLRALAHEMVPVGGSTEVRVRGTFPPVVNGASVGARAHAALTAAGESVYLLPAPSPACDDVATLADHLGADLGYWFVGCMDPVRFGEADLARIARGEQPRDVPGHHTREFTPSEDFLAVGARQLTIVARALWNDPLSTRKPEPHVLAHSRRRAS